MDHDELIGTTRMLGGFSSDAETERAVEAVLETLGERLTEAAAVRLATFLPQAAGLALLQRRVPGAFGRRELADRVARRQGMGSGHAIEQVIVVCEALATLLPVEEADHLRGALPPEMAELVTRRLRAGQPHHQQGRAAEPDHTLAGGRQGSRHPLSEAHPERAQSHSVARSDDPHGDTKLSSSRGLTQEREDHSLATGRPGSTRPLSSNR